jgi:hypothetical protein
MSHLVNFVRNFDDIEDELDTKRKGGREDSSALYH